MTDSAYSDVDVLIHGDPLILRPLRAGEIDAEWREMVAADPMGIAELPDEAGFRARLARSGRMHDGWLDLAIDLHGTSIGRIQTFVPPHRPTPPGTYTIGIGVRAEARGKGYGGEALALFTGWLFSHARAKVVEAPTDPANMPMRAVFDRVGWQYAGTIDDYDREWTLYRITREQWEVSMIMKDLGCHSAQDPS